MAKFIVGVVVGIFLGASVGAYGARRYSIKSSSGWTVTKYEKRGALILRWQRAPSD